jgi:hypothetical protein
VAKVWRKSCAPCRSTASSSGSRGGGSADQRPAWASPSVAARPAACSSPSARCMVPDRTARPCGELVERERTARRAEHLEDAGGGRPQVAGGVGELGDGGAAPGGCRRRSWGGA